MDIQELGKAHFPKHISPIPALCGTGTTGRFFFPTWRNSLPSKRSLCHVGWMGGTPTFPVISIPTLCPFGIILTPGWSNPVAFVVSGSPNGAVERDFTWGNLGYFLGVCALIAQYLFLFLQNIQVVTGRHTLLSSTDWMGGIFDLGKWRWCCYGN